MLGQNRDILTFWVRQKYFLINYKQAMKFVLLRRLTLWALFPKMLGQLLMNDCPTWG